MKPLVSSTVAAPGFFGLNTQESSVTLESGFALVSDNCVIDKYGRLGARKGWRYVTSGSTGVNIKGMHRFVDITGAETIISWSDTGFYKGTGTLTSIAVTTDNTLNAGNWQAVTLNDKAYFFQEGFSPMVYDPVANSIQDIDDSHDYHAIAPQAGVALSAYGRIFAAATAGNKTTVYWTSLLDGADWGTGSAGSLDLSSVLVQGTDSITGLGAQNGQLIVFLQRSIVIFADTDTDATFNPTNLRLVEVINRVGCVARDSIQNTGNDILFLSEDGLRSLGRVIQEKSLPMRDVSKNIRDDLVQVTATENKADIKSVYSEDNAFYLLLFPSIQRVYCFDMRTPLDDGSARVTLWDTQTQTSMLSLPNDVYFGQVDGIAQYAGYSDNNSTYRIKYYTTYFDFENPTQTKIVKRIAVTVIGGSGQDFIIKSGADYTDSYQSYPATLNTKQVFEYGVGEYNVAEYETGTLSEVVRIPAGGNGNVIQVGFEANVNGSEFSIQKMDVFIKQGRVY